MEIGTMMATTNIDIRWVDISPDNKIFYSEVFEAEIFISPLSHKFVISKRTPNIFNRGMWDYSLYHDIKMVSDDGFKEELTDGTSSTMPLGATSKDEAIKKANEHIQQYFNN